MDREGEILSRCPSYSTSLLSSWSKKAKFDIVAALPLFAARLRGKSSKERKIDRQIFFCLFLSGGGDNRWDFTLCRNFYG